MEAESRGLRVPSGGDLALAIWISPPAIVRRSPPSASTVTPLASRRPLPADRIEGGEGTRLLILWLYTLWRKSQRSAVV